MKRFSKIKQTRRFISLLVMMFVISSFTISCKNKSTRAPILPPAASAASLRPPTSYAAYNPLGSANGLATPPGYSIPTDLSVPAEPSTPELPFHQKPAGAGFIGGLIGAGIVGLAWGITEAVKASKSSGKKDCKESGGQWIKKDKECKMPTPIVVERPVTPPVSSQQTPVTVREVAPPPAPKKQTCPSTDPTGAVTGDLAGAVATGSGCTKDPCPDTRQAPDTTNEGNETPGQ